MSKRRNKTEWQRLIEEQETSSLTQKAFCEQAESSNGWPCILRGRSNNLPRACGRPTSPPARYVRILNMPVDIDGLSLEELM